MERGYGSARTTGRSERSHEIPLRFTSSSAFPSSCRGSGACSRHQDEIMEPGRGDRRGCRYRSYRVKFASDSVLWRNRRFLRHMVPAAVEEEDSEAPESSDPLAAVTTEPQDAGRQPAADAPPAPRRSARTRKPRVHFSN
ncbi:hypothetical protein DAPPUDRAFT_103752 [Daphnia pulex]|uniref:Uncharacterized protein n=1 Tax=Daphnia pulex TaxID=6669 RepID=E9GK27_DAPPU|nr:hypothetical protein DAPPUDRAFT_103752 [Daphnia pulex]|eukprot:EFX80224.1 hypothetical protein DAPPUDRAFT_103752 [Daphnia pulex]